MQSSVHITARYNIPIHYQCSKCNTNVFASIPISYMSMKSQQGYLNEDRKRELVNSAVMDAYKGVEDSVRTHYQKDAVHHCEKIVGRCCRCGNIEAWQKDPNTVLKKQRASQLGPCIMLFLAFVASVAFGAMTDSLWIGALSFVLTIAAYFLVLTLIEKLNSRKEIVKDPVGFMDRNGVLEASRPKYVFTLEAVLPRLKTDVRIS